MSKLTAREIQVFVAGVIAYLGFELIVWGPYPIIHSQDTLAILSFAVGGVAILLALGIIAGSVRALRWLQVTLWLGLINGGISICVSVFQKFGIPLNVPHMGLYRAISSLLTFSGLLFLIARSRSKPPGGDRTPDIVLEPTTTAP